MPAVALLRHVRPAEGLLHLARYAARPSARAVDVDPVGACHETQQAIGAAHLVAAVRADAPEVLHPGANLELLACRRGAQHGERRAADQPYGAGRGVPLRIEPGRGARLHRRMREIAKVHARVQPSEGVELVVADGHAGSVHAAHDAGLASTLPAPFTARERAARRSAVAARGLPLPLRNALAALAIAALEDDAAVGALEWVARPAGEPPASAGRWLADVHLIERRGTTLLAVHAPHAEAAAAHAARALRAAEAHRASAPPCPGDPITVAVRRAAALWRERLFFEVHEVLEAVWKTAAGEPRHALQGVIQIAVAYHHFAHGNLRGARALMTEGRGRLGGVSPGALPPLDLGALLEATAPWADALAAGGPFPYDPPPLALAL